MALLSKAGKDQIVAGSAPTFSVLQRPRILESAESATRRVTKPHIKSCVLVTRAWNVLVDSGDTCGPPSTGKRAASGYICCDTCCARAHSRGSAKRCTAAARQALVASDCQETQQETRSNFATNSKSRGAGSCHRLCAVGQRQNRRAPEEQPAPRTEAGLVQRSQELVPRRRGQRKAQTRAARVGALVQTGEASLCLRSTAITPQD